MSSPQGIGGLLAGGGISPLQQALAQYATGEDIINQLQNFSSPTGGGIIGTMPTQAISGSRAKGAELAAKQSQADQAAQANSINQQFGQLSSGLGNILAKGGGSGGGSTSV